jgi:signal peptidase II
LRPLPERGARDRGFGVTRRIGAVSQPADGSLRLRVAYLAVAIGVIVLDQITKAVVAARIPLHATINVIPGFFDLTHVRNTGAAFGILAGEASSGRTLLLTGVALVVFSGVVVYAWRSPARDTILQSALAFISGGAVGNLIDRIRFDSVTDFLRFYVGAHEWPSFNMADSAITTGVLLLAWDIWRRPGQEPAASPGKAAA